MSATLPIVRNLPADGERASGGTSGDTDVPGGRTGRLFIIAALVLLVAGLTTWLVAFSPVLGARSVTVRGAHNLTGAQVLSAAGITHATPLVRLDAGAAARRIEALPDVASASVRISYPSSVIITVTERIAVGYLKAGNTFTLVDGTGDQYRTVRSKPLDLPLFAVPVGADAKGAGQAVATVAASLRPTLLASVASIQSLDPSAITLLLLDHRVVRWGGAERSADKARILLVLLTQRGTEFDVTNPDQVVTR